MRTALLTLTLAAGAALAAGPAHAQSDGLTAKQIVDQAVAHSFVGQTGTEADVRMVLTGKRGAERTRLLRVQSAREGGLARSLVRITEPADVAGTGFLYREGRSGQDELWLYVPALKRARRIVGRARHGRFLGSDFTYADLEAQELRASTLTRLADESVGRFACRVVEARPLPSAQSEYGRIVAWVRKDNGIAIRLKMFSPAGALVKVLFVRRIGTGAGGKPMITETRMTSEREGTFTLLTVLRTRPLGGAAADRFTERNLSRGL
jgi:hypothetical protein